MENYNSWKDKLFSAHIKKLLKGEKNSPNVLSSKKYLEAQQLLTEMTIGDFILSSENYMYTNFQESLREQMFNSLSDDLKKDISFIMRMMACKGIGYIEESTLGEYYPFVKSESSMPRGLDIFYKYFKNDDEKINKPMLESIKKFLIYNKFEKNEDKKFLIDFISSDNLTKECLFLSSFVNIFSEKYFPEPEYKEKIKEKYYLRLGK